MYIDIIKWYKKNNLPYDETTFKNIEDVKKKQREILDFANSKATLTEKFVWEIPKLKQGIKDEIAKAMERNNDRYFHEIKTEIDVNADYDAVVKISVDASYTPDTVNRLQERKQEKLQRLGREVVEEVKRVKLEELERVRIPEQLRPQVRV